MALALHVPSVLRVSTGTEITEIRLCKAVLFLGGGGQSSKNSVTPLLPS